MTKAALKFALASLAIMASLTALAADQQACIQTIDTSLYPLKLSKRVDMSTVYFHPTDGPVLLQDGTVLTPADDKFVYNTTKSGELVGKPYLLKDIAFARPMVIPSGPHAGVAVLPTKHGLVYFRSPTGAWKYFQTASNDDVLISRALFLPPDNVVVVASEGTAYYFKADGTPVVGANGKQKTVETHTAIMDTEGVVLKDGSIALCSNTQVNKLSIVRPNASIETIPTAAPCVRGGASTPEGGVAFPINDGRVYVVDASGKLKFKTAGVKAGYSLYSQISVHKDGTIVVGDSDDTLHMYRMDGSEKCSYYAGGSIYTTSLLSDGSSVLGTLLGDNADPVCEQIGVPHSKCTDTMMLIVSPNCTLKAAIPTEDRVLHFPLVIDDKTIVATGGAPWIDFYEIGSQPIHSESRVALLPSNSCSMAAMPTKTQTH